MGRHSDAACTRSANVAFTCGEEGSRALIGIAPVDVDITSVGFLACTPLLDLLHAAAAA
jgi:hypothetical protein